MKGRSQFETLSGCRLEGVNFPPALGNWWKTTASRTCLLSLRNEVISNLKNEINPLTSICNLLCYRAVEHAAFVFMRMPTHVHFNIHPHMCPINLPARRNNNFYTSAFQLSHPPVECVRWAASWRSLFGSKCGHPFCMWCGGCPHTSTSQTLSNVSLSTSIKKKNKKTQNINI